MNIIYKELMSEEDFNQCIQLQKNVFGLSEVDLISPLILKLISRNNPPIGISLGLFSNENDELKLIGFIIGLATFIDNSIYVIIMGIDKDYQNKGLGFSLFKKYRELAISKNLTNMYCITDPLESNLAYLFFHNLGFKAVKYEKEAYKVANITDKNYIPIDKFAINWEFNNQRTIKKIEKKYLINAKEIIDNNPIVSLNKMPHSDLVLVEIPIHFQQLKKQDFKLALKYRMESRKIFSEYLNKRKYYVIDCISVEENNDRKTYYILEKQ